MEKLKTRKQKTQYKKEVADFVLSEIENHTNAGVSPVYDTNFVDLSKKYAATKKKLVGNKDADLHLKNQMISSLFAKPKVDGVEFKITDKQQKLKSDNHNNGVTIPQRRFLPDDTKKKGKNAKFGETISEGIKQIFKDINANSD